jgi:hypothetical protein
VVEETTQKTEVSLALGLASVAESCFASDITVIADFLAVVLQGAVTERRRRRSVCMGVVLFQRSCKPATVC